MRRNVIRTLTALAFGGLFAVAACSDTTGPGFGDVSVVMTSDATSANRVGEGISLSLLGDVPESAVGSLLLSITRVDLHLVGGDSGTEGTESQGEGGEGEGGEGETGWISLEITLTEPFDVMALSTAGVELAAGTVTAGRYNLVRFFFDTSQIVLDEDIDVNGETIVAGTYDVTVPSAEQTGLKLQLSGTDVGDGETETVGVQVGTGATIGTLLRNSSGFQLSPALHEQQVGSD